MNKKIILLIFLIVIVGFIFVFSKGQDEKSIKTERVAGTIFPIYDLVRNITGDLIDVQLILPPGSSPHTFDPSPGVVRGLQGTSVVYSVGHGLDDWAVDLVGVIGADNKIIDDNIELRSQEGRKESDPHYWLSVKNAKKIANTIASDLSIRFPQYELQIRANLERYLTELDLVDNEINGLIVGVENKNLITFHDAWYYFAEAYGLKVVGSFEPTGGREPTPQYLIKLISGLKEAGVNTVYSEPQFGKGGIEVFATDNNLKIIELDTIGGVKGRDSYIDLMRYNATQISQNR